MLREGEIYFNTNTSLDMHIYLEKYPSIPVANEDYEEVLVEGRSGSLIINKGTYPDKKIPLTFTLLHKDIYVKFDKIYEWLTNIVDNRLVCSRKDRCYRVKKILFGNIEKEFRTIGEFEVIFICEPFSEDLDQTIYEITTNNFKFNYDGNAPADTLIKVYGSGNVQLTIDNETMQINNVTDYIEIDSNLLQVRNQDGTSKDDDLGDFILLEKGEHTISYTGTVTKIILEYTTKYKS